MEDKITLIGLGTSRHLEHKDVELAERRILIDAMLEAVIEAELKRNLTPSIGEILTMGALFYPPPMTFPPNLTESTYERELPRGTHIVKEYDLIQKKQSKLSKWDRDAVVTIFEERYSRVE